MVVSIVLLVLVLVIGTTVFSAIAERRNPAIGNFVDAQGLWLHYIEVAIPVIRWSSFSMEMDR